MHSKEPNYQSYISKIQQWDNKGDTKAAAFYVRNRLDVTKIANAIRNEGFFVTTRPVGYFYQITVERKVN